MFSLFRKYNDNFCDLQNDHDCFINLILGIYDNLTKEIHACIVGGRTSCFPCLVFQRRISLEKKRKCLRSEVKATYMQV